MRALAPELWPFVRGDQVTDAARERDARPPGFPREFDRVAREHEAAIREFERFDRCRRRLRLGLPGKWIGVWRYHLASACRGSCFAAPVDRREQTAALLAFVQRNFVDGRTVLRGDARKIVQTVCACIV